MDSGKRILIVEDDQALQTALEGKLQHEGFRVASAQDGEEGLRLALETKPDLILLDLFMPKMDGATMMDHLRQDPWGRKVPIIVLTNFDPDAKMTGKIIADQPSYYFLKTDIQLDELIEKIREIFSLSSNGTG